MDEEIRERLAHIEISQDVRILYACESGSRAWGFPSPDSDYDVRFLYVHPLPWYLRIHPGRDVIVLPIDGDLDINGWDLRKALQLMLKGNQSVYEWLNSPIIYSENPACLKELRQLSSRAYRRRAALGHYFGIASRIAAEHLHTDDVPIKKVLYVLRSMLAGRWAAERQEQPPVSMELLVAGAGTRIEDGIRQEIADILEAKQSAMERETICMSTRMTDFIDQSMVDLRRCLQEWDLSEPPQDTSLADNLFLRWVSE
ncbi:nucleotidyltransferase domain-containing protein [Acidithiobacillus montserratensis]|uniref:Nucleotidyltransferase domain-containing protein n=1 Tax=Acidithiobacillus montserratensis TaxID=2729135 RepID=A0ACD5HI11_9PROT|nr:nucleotidyltransferase domain-containing protein [Acidithiobacillus montserratensis]MBU2749093.1 nucleotidyltransferase domain-containing protein [Acidithiobacillus montserratensis]